MEDAAVVTVVPSLAFNAVLRADAALPGVPDCRAALLELAQQGACMGCKDPAKLAAVYLAVLECVVSSAGASLTAWKRAFRASRLRVKLAGQGELLL